MHTKKTASLVVGLIGVVLILFGLYGMNRVSSTRSKVNHVTAPMSSTPVGGAMRKAADHELGGYASKAQWCLIGGIVLLVVGGGAYYVMRKKKR
jgi:hypothetical protein